MVSSCKKEDNILKSEKYKGLKMSEMQFKQRVTKIVDIQEDMKNCVCFVGKI